jgi:hypothetical protein
MDSEVLARDKEVAKNDGVFYGVDLPSRNDVLMGKGRPNQQHPGNVHLRMLVEDCIDEYQAAHGLVDKSDIVHKVCLMIKDRSGRFLQKDDDGWWRESTYADAVAKVRKLFQGTHRKKIALVDNAHATTDNGDNDTSTFLHKGKRPRFDDGCCGI